MRKTHYSNDIMLGDRWRECDECGFDYKRSQLKKRYDGAIVCPECWEPQHPRDRIKVKPSKIVKVD